MERARRSQGCFYKFILELKTLKNPKKRGPLSCLSINDYGNRYCWKNAHFLHFLPKRISSFTAGGLVSSNREPPVFLTRLVDLVLRFVDRVSIISIKITPSPSLGLAGRESGELLPKMSKGKLLHSRSLYLCSRMRHQNLFMPCK